MLEELTWDVGLESERAHALRGKLEHLMIYRTANLAAIRSHADRQRHGEPIATQLLESTGQRLVHKRLVNKRRIRWTPNGVHRLLQVRAAVHNQQLRSTIERWHPELRSTASALALRRTLPPGTALGFANDSWRRRPHYMQSAAAKTSDCETWLGVRR
jgi:hypothetical protein